VTSAHWRFVSGWEDQALSASSSVPGSTRASLAPGTEGWSRTSSRTCIHPSTIHSPAAFACAGAAGKFDVVSSHVLSPLEAEVKAVAAHTVHQPGRLPPSRTLYLPRVRGRICMPCKSLFCLPQRSQRLTKASGHPSVLPSRFHISRPHGMQFDVGMTGRSPFPLRLIRQKHNSSFTLVGAAGVLCGDPPSRVRPAPCWGLLRNGASGRCEWTEHG
jgi:hypothetical protein